MAANKKKVSLSQIAQYLNANGIETEIRGNGAEPFSLSSPTSADDESIVFWFNEGKVPANFKNIAVSNNYVSKYPLPPDITALIVKSNPKLAFAYATHLYIDYAIGGYNPNFSFVAASASIAPTAQISHFTHIGENSSICDRSLVYPFTYIGNNVTIGEGTIIKPHCVILDDTIIGKGCLLESGCVIGGDGFGFVRHGDKAIKVEHLGRVIIGDYVEVNANGTIDKGTLDDTVIGDYTKLDNLVQVAHNNVLGRANLVAAQVGVSGSSVIGDYNTFGGQVGMAEGLNIGSQNMIAGKTGITKDIGSNQIISGFPSRPNKEELARQANINKISKMIERIKKLEQEIENLKKEIHADND